jgi:hypothetical protein
MRIKNLARTSRSAGRYSRNLYAFFKSIIGCAPLRGLIDLGLRLMHKLLMVAGFVIGLKSVSGRLDSYLAANFDLALIPKIGHHVILILVVSVLFAAAIAVQYIDLSLKSAVSLRFGKYVQARQIDSIFGYAQSNNLNAGETAEILAEFSKKYATNSVRRLAMLAELMLLIGQCTLSSIVFLAIIVMLSPAFGLPLFLATAVVVLYSIKKDYYRKIAVHRDHERDSTAENKLTLTAPEWAETLQSKGLAGGRARLLESINDKALIRQLRIKRMKDSIKVAGSMMLSITIIAFLFFLSFGGIDIKHVPWMHVIVVYFAVRNSMNDIRMLMRCITSLNQHYDAITAFLDMLRGSLDWPAELGRSMNVSSVEDLSMDE